jgi:hypothetical protein
MSTSSNGSSNHSTSSSNSSSDSSSDSSTNGSNDSSSRDDVWELCCSPDSTLGNVLAQQGLIIHHHPQGFSLPEEIYHATYIVVERFQCTPQCVEIKQNLIIGPHNFTGLHNSSLSFIGLVLLPDGSSKLLRGCSWIGSRCSWQSGSASSRSWLLLGCSQLLLASPGAASMLDVLLAPASCLLAGRRC